MKDCGSILDQPWPNHALQRTAPRVTVAADSGLGIYSPSHLCPAFVASFIAPPSQLPRHAPPSLSLRSLAQLQSSLPTMKKQKTINILIALVFSTLASAQDSSLPERAQRLKESYETAVERATTPLTKTYITELTKLKFELTKKADLQGALAIERELSARGAITQQPPIGTATTAPASAKPILVGEAWHWTSGSYDKPTTFKLDGTFQNGWFMGTWDLKGKKLNLKYYNPGNSDKKHESSFDLNAKDGTYIGKDFQGNIVTLKPNKPTQK